MIYVAVTLGLVLLVAAAVYFWPRGAPSPDSPTARALEDAASSEAKQRARDAAAQIANAPTPVIDARVEALRARGRVGK